MPSTSSSSPTDGSPAAAWRRRIGRGTPWCVLALAFSLPLSTTAITVAAILALVCWLIEGDFRRKFLEMTADPVCIALAVYLGCLLAGLAWTEHFGNGLAAIEKQWKILLLPVFLTVIDHRRRWWYLIAFLVGMSIAMAITYLAWFDVIRYADVTPQHLTKKTFHVVYNPMLALAIYLVLHQLFWGGARGGGRLLLLGLAGLMIFNMFITEGRAGQMVFFALLILLAGQLCRANLARGLLLALLVLPGLFFVGYQVSPVFHGRLDQAAEEIATFRVNPRTSVGLRLLYWSNSLEIIRQHPLLGAGTGDFNSAYALVNSKVSPTMPATDNPHNQYFLALCQLGLLGLASLLAIFLIQFRMAARQTDGWGRIRVAFPLFFLVIMTTESYLLVYETGLLFALVGAILAKRPPREEEWTPAVDGTGQRQRTWLVLSYRAGIAGSACSQHIDDRLPILARHGITPIVLTGPIGGHSGDFKHFRAWSLAPSGIRFEVRHFLRRHCRRRWQFKVLETLILLPILPFYLVEKILINLESEWSWCMVAAVRGVMLRWRYRPELLYSTGGSASAHAAALLVHRLTGVPWIAETQDPLVHDQDWQRSSRVYRLYRWLERRIALDADAFVFLTRQALENARQRVGLPFPGVCIYPGSPPDPSAGRDYLKGELCRFAHFGTLAGSRNLVVFLQALVIFFREHPDQRRRIRLDLYGSLDEESRRQIASLEMDDLVTHHGLVGRDEARRAMRQADCLLLIQNTTFFSTETIPSKVYEYLASGRPVLGLVHHNEELAAMLRSSAHWVAAADDPRSVAGCLREILGRHAATSFASGDGLAADCSVDQAVAELLFLAASAAAARGTAGNTLADLHPRPCPLHKG